MSSPAREAITWLRTRSMRALGRVLPGSARIRPLAVLDPRVSEAPRTAPRHHEIALPERVRTVLERDVLLAAPGPGDTAPRDQVALIQLLVDRDDPPDLLGRRPG